MARALCTAVIHGILLDENATLSLAEICEVSGLTPEEMMAVVEEGVLEPLGESPEAWRFTGAHLRRLLTALRLQRELELELPGLALVLDLLEEVQALRARLKALEG